MVVVVEGEKTMEGETMTGVMSAAIFLVAMVFSLISLKNMD